MTDVADRDRRRQADEGYLADAVLTVDPSPRLIRPGVVDVLDGRVSYCGPPAGAPDPARPRRRVGGLLMPGLVNTHAHGPMTVFRGAAESVDLSAFLTKVLWPREAHLVEDDVYWGMLLACSEMLRCGVTTSCEMYYFEQAMLAAVLDAGSRCVITPGVVQVPGWSHLGSWQQRLAAVTDFADANRGRHSRVQIGIAAHAAYSLPMPALDEIATAARERNALLHIHIAETRDEGRDIEEQFGASVPTVLADRGFFGGPVLAAHSVWLSERDIGLYAECGVAVAHCPQSNAKLASGIAPLSALLAAGIPVGLGTDGPASNNNLDLWEELRLAPLLARLATADPAAVPVGQALELATRRGGVALGLDGVGSLAVGSWADMVRVDLDDPAFAPLLEADDLLTHLVWSCGSRLVTDVWVAGRQVVADGQCTTVDLAEARRRVQRSAERLRAGVTGTLPRDG